MDPKQQLDEAQIGGLRKFFDTLYPGLVHQDDFLKSFDRVLAKVRELEKKNADKFETIKQKLSDTFGTLRASLEARVSTLTSDTEGRVADLISRADERLAAVDSRLAEVHDGIDADPEAVKRAVLADIVLPDVKEAIVDTPEDIRNKLELLQSEERLKSSAIIGIDDEIAALKKELKSIPKYAGAVHSPLSFLPDVDVTGITTGQALKWDGIRWIPFTPAGGATTAVYNEVVSGSGTSFTLAHAPTAGKERIYAIGQRKLPTSDYTISGAVVTMVLSWSAGDISADYEY